MTRLLVVLPFIAYVLVALTTPDSATQIHGDIDLYYRVSLAALHGSLPYRDVALEYPPLALAPMLVPRLLLPDPALGIVPYRLVFAAWNGVLASTVCLLALVIVRRVRPAADPRWVVATAAFLLILGADILPWRLDLFPIGLTAGAAFLLLRGQPRAAGVLLGLAVGAKLYPAVLWPVFVLWLLAAGDRRSAIRLTVAMGVTVALVFAPFFIADPSAAMLPFRYQAGRGLEIESVAAGIVQLLGLVDATTVSVVNVFSAIHVTSPLAPLFLDGALLLTATGFALVFVTVREAFHGAGDHADAGDHVDEGDGLRGERLIAAIVLTLSVLLITSKIFSAQFAWWLLPFAALLRPSRLALALVAVALTAGIYPPGFGALTDQSSFGIGLLLARNVALLALAVAVWSDVRPRRSRPSLAIRTGIVVNALAVLAIALLVIRAVMGAPRPAGPTPCPPAAVQQGRPVASPAALPPEPGDCRPS